MANVTKRELVIELSNKLGLRQSEVMSMVEAFIEEVSATLERGDEVTLRTFGTFELRKAKSKIGRNPKRPGSEVVIPERFVVRFKPGMELKQRVADLPVKDSK
ncbi:MAG TPA: integration host factor subunit beta [Verrucomicrobiales bacterium]|nr:integration host factor subunit beta [Verrucomicrobiales bacterium]HRJ08142.1 HU family DNA-binding protein [Prosthecobacter sp.]HRK13785.1 HU family DNA-binding protein [Prosthecobacter sp.]